MTKYGYTKNVYLILFFAIFGFGTLSSEEDSLDMARKTLLDKVSGEWAAHGIYTVVKLGLPEMLDTGPMHYKELAKKSDTDPQSLYRLLRALASLGIFFEDEGNFFSHTETSRFLSGRHPSSLKALTTFYGGVIHQSWEGFEESLRKGTTGFKEHFGVPVFQYFRENKEDFELFHAAMREKSKAVIDSCLKCCDFSAFNLVYDIGGGKGHFLLALLEIYPGLRGVLFDLPEVIADIEKEGVACPERCALAAGNFFEEIPRGGDLYLLKSVIHDWNDAQAKEILVNCREAMGAGGLLIVIEPTLGEKNLPDYAKMMDLLMLNVTGGKERTLEDFSSLLKACGFSVEKVVPTSTEFKMILARPW